MPKEDSSHAPPWSIEWIQNICGDFIPDVVLLDKGLLVKTQRERILELRIRREPSMDVARPEYTIVRLLEIQL